MISESPGRIAGSELCTASEAVTNRPTSFSGIWSIASERSVFSRSSRITSDSEKDDQPSLSR